MVLRLSTLPWGRALPLLPTRYLPLCRGQAQVGPSQHPAEGLGGDLGLQVVMARVSCREKLGEGHEYQAVPPSVPTTQPQGVGADGRSRGTAAAGQGGEGD